MSFVIGTSAPTSERPIALVPASSASTVIAALADPRVQEQQQAAIWHQMPRSWQVAPPALPLWLQGVPDVEPWDADLLQLPSYHAATKPVGNATAPLEPLGLVGASPVEAAPAAPEIKKSKEERLRERHAGRVEAHAKKLEAMAASGEKPHDKLSMRHITSAAGLVLKSFLNPTQVAAEIYKQVQEREDAHKARNEEAHKAALPQQHRHRLEKLQSEAEDGWQRVGVFRVLPVTETHLVESLKIEAKNLFLKGVIGHVQQTYVVAVLVGGVEPMRKFQRFVTHRLAQRQRRLAGAAEALGVEEPSSDDDDAPPGALGGQMVFAAPISKWGADNVLFRRRADKSDEADPQSHEEALRMGGRVRVMKLASGKVAYDAFVGLGVGWAWDAAVSHPTPRWGDAEPKPSVDAEDDVAAAAIEGAAFSLRTVRLP